MKSLKNKGFTIFEILVVMFILILVTLAFFKGILDLFKYIKIAKIHSVAKELGEKIRGDIYTSSYDTLSLCFTSFEEGSLNTSGNTTWAFSFVDESFYTKTCNLRTNCALLYCKYCYAGETLEPKSQSENCTSGYPIMVGYKAGKIKDNTTQEEVGMAIGVNIYFKDPRTGYDKELKYFLFKEKRL